MLGKIIFGALLCVVVLTPIAYGTVEPWWKAVFICAVLGIFILGICETAIRSSFSENSFPLLLPLLALTLFAFLQTLISADPFQTKFFALQLAALTAFLALLYRYAATEDRIRVLLYTVIGVAVATALFGILRQTTQQQTGFVLPLLKPNQGFAQFINKNHFAYLMELGFGFGLGLLIGERGMQHRVLVHVALLLPIWVGLVLSNSRGGILAMFIQVVVAALLLMSFRSEVARTPRLLAVRAGLIVVLVAGVLFGTLWIGGDRLVSTIEAAGTDLSANTPLERDGASRNEIWRASVKLFASQPLFGVGLGAYWPRISAHHDASGVLVPQEAHNDYLELLASGGVVGFALGVWFVVSAFRVARKSLWSNSGFVCAARLGAIVGIAGVAVHSLFDFGLHLLGNAVVFLTAIMIATAQIGSKKFVDLQPQQQLDSRGRRETLMNQKRRKASIAVAALLLFSILQVGLQAGLAKTNSTKTGTSIAQQIVARLVTRNNQPITLNGQSVNTGASILSGATIETGADQSATVNVGSLGQVDISPNTKVVLTFEQGNLKALVIYGCVILTARQNTAGEVATEQGSVGKTDPAVGGVVEMCFPQGAAAPVVGPGVAVGAGAGTGASTGTAAAGAGGLFGLGVPATIAVVAIGTAAGLTPLFFDDDADNPSPSAP